MLLFLLCYLAIYGGAHAWLLWRTVRVFQLGAPFPIILAGLAVFMILAPILVRILERAGLEAPAKAVADVGYLWMGFFFLCFSAALTLELARLLLALAGWLAHRDLVPPEAWAVTLAIVLGVVGALYGYFEASRVRVERVTLHTPKLPAGSRPLCIVQISDVHLGVMVGEEKLAKILGLVQAANPDLLVSTGDLVDSQRDGLRGLDRVLATVQPRLGCYAVLGNHEVIAGLAPSVSFTEQAGFRLLRGEVVPAGEVLTLVGVDDPALRGREAGLPEAALLDKVPKDRFTILLKHRPKVEESSKGRFDLQLSGHVHKGQIFPFNLVTHLVYPAPLGLSDAGLGSRLYVSRGTGTWGPPIRVFAPPEVTIIDILPAAHH